MVKTAVIKADTIVQVIEARTAHEAHAKAVRVADPRFTYWDVVDARRKNARR